MFLANVPCIVRIAIQGFGESVRGPAWMSDLEANMVGFFFWHLKTSFTPGISARRREMGIECCVA